MSKILIVSSEKLSPLREKALELLKTNRINESLHLYSSKHEDVIAFLSCDGDEAASKEGWPRGNAQTAIFFADDWRRYDVWMESICINSPKPLLLVISSPEEILTLIAPCEP